MDQKTVQPEEMQKNELSHYVQIDKDLCNGCVLCLRVCPTKAIRVRDHKVACIEGFCVDCGECIRVCPQGAVKAITTGSDAIDRSKAVLVVSPVLYSQFGEGVNPDDINEALKRMGFLEVYDEFEALEIYNAAVELYIKENKDSALTPRPLISAVCPVVVRLIAYRFPSLLNHLPPILRPREIVARDAKKETARKYGLRENEIKVFHVTPCSAKMIAIKNPLLPKQSYLDGAIGINEVYHSVEKTLKEVNRRSTSSPRSIGIGIGWGKSGGEISGMDEGNFLAVSGLQETIRYLEKIEMGLLNEFDYVEFRTTWEGCIGGALTVTDRYQAKHTIDRMILKSSAKKKVNRTQVKTLYEKGWFFTHHEPTPLKEKDTELSVSEAIERQQRVEELYRSLPAKECGVCGAPDCRAFAEDVVDGRAALKDCVYVRLFHGRGEQFADI
jgi:Na+-translocating ferredoxin:NAD+ oxidoreductase RNF subunit RnfB